jgi:hypothetical protein
MPDELEKKFIQAFKDMFDNFIKENIGIKESETRELLPDCVDSGDDYGYCLFYPIRSSC